MAGRFTDKVVLVVGGGRGMGKAIARRFLDEGAHVVISARTMGPAEETLKEFQALGKASLVQADIADRDSMKAMVETVGQEHGVIDVLIHCAADNGSGMIADMPDETYDFLVRCNMMSIFWVAKDAAPYLSKARDKGRLIYISSGSANRTFLPGLVPYASSKAYMNAFARGLAVEFGPRDILVNVVEPGMTASDRMKAELPEEVAHAVAQSFPVKRPGTPEDIANACAFLASAEAEYITGSALLVDGGASMAQLGAIQDARMNH
jgi:3-oxoacyl-[acyl-carrier protein] reductase